MITQLLVQSIHISLWLEGGGLGAGLETAVLVEGVGAMGVAGTVVWLEAEVEVLEKLDTFMVSTHVCQQYTPYTPNTPIPNLHPFLQQHHLGKFLYFYLLD